MNKIFEKMNKVFTFYIKVCILYSESVLKKEEIMSLKWEYNLEQHYFFSLNNIYCSKPIEPSLQSLNIFVPGVLMNKDGSINRQAVITTSSGKCYTSKTIPIIFYNDIGGYAECKPAMLTARNKRYLDDGYVLVSVGARGRQSKNNNMMIGKAPAGLVDLKAALRWLRKYHDELPGDIEKIISVGTSAGGAMSSLLGVTGDNIEYFPLLDEIGAEMSTSDCVYASQCYCPITNLSYADMAYEWMFHRKKIYTFSAKSKPVLLTPDEQRLSNALAMSFPHYLNQLELGEELGEDGRSGSFYHAILQSLTDSLSKFLDKQTTNFICKQELVSELDELSAWTQWQDESIHITDLDAYVRYYIGRMKPCPSFDGLNKQTPENEVFGTSDISHRHFSSTLYEQLKNLSFPKEILSQFESDIYSDVQKQESLMNPLTFLNSENINKSKAATHFRICVGSKDADTSFAISRILFLALKKWGIEVDYELIWGMGHCDADYKEEFCYWVDKITN